MSIAHATCKQSHTSSITRDVLLAVKLKFDLSTGLPNFDPWQTANRLAGRGRIVEQLY